MIEFIQNKFKHLLGRFSYRQRFIFWVVIVFLVAPLPAYWILNTQYCFSSRAHLQLLGSKEARVWLKVFDAVVDNYIAWTCRIAAGEGDSNELSSLRRAVNEALDILKEHNASSEKEMIKRQGFFYQGNLIKNRKEDSVLLEQIWERISHQMHFKDIKSHEVFYHQSIAKLSQKIHEIAYDYHLTLHTDSSLQVLSQKIYFSLVHDLTLLVELNEKIANLRIGGETRQEMIDRAKITMNSLHNHFERTKVNLEATYRELQAKKIWKEFSYHDVQEHLAHCYQLNVRLIDKVKANLIAVEDEKIVWPGSNSLFIKNADCMQKSRKIANDIFDELLIKEKNFYLWQQAIVVLALSFFIFIIIIFIIFRFLTSHFKQMHGYIQGLSKGNFFGKMNTNPNEEMGQIAIAFQKMGKSIEEVVNQLKALGFSLAEANEKIDITAHEQAHVMTVQENCLANLEKTIKQIALNSRELSDTMNTFTQIYKERLEKDESGKRLQHLQDKMNGLKLASISILDVLSSVHKKGLNTRKLTTHMTKISDQASLLALNAAIESLNVGELQSFNDITEKIQHFAQTTSTSTLAIQKNVHEMSQSVELGKVTTESCIKEVTVGANRLIEVSNQLQTITSQDALQDDKFYLVNVMMQKQAKRSEEIIKSVTELNLISNENKESVDKLYKTISELGIFSQELRSVLHTLFSEEGVQK